MSNDRYKEIRDALAMGPTPGPRRAVEQSVIGPQDLSILFAKVTFSVGINGSHSVPIEEAIANAALAAACDPDTIRELLAERDQLAAQRPAGDGCHCATCTCNPNMTPAVRFDLSPAQMEGAIRDHLIRLGWTPPEQRAEIERLRADVEEMQRRLDREESDHGRTIDQRDAAGDALGRMFQAVTGRTAEWSSAWGYVDAIEEVEEHVATLATERDQLAAALEAAQMGLRYAVRVWVLSDEIKWSEAEIDEVVESIKADAAIDQARGKGEP